MQETQVQSLICQDPTCRGTTTPMYHNYWACALEPGSCNYWSPRAWSPCSATREVTATKSSHISLQLESSPRSPQLEQSPHSNKDLAQPKINKIVNLKYIYILEDFPGGLVVKILPSNAGGMGSIPVWGIRIPCALRPTAPPKKKPINNIVTISVKTLKKRSTSNQNLF